LFLFTNPWIFVSASPLDIYMKRGAVQSLLLAFALVLLQACAWDITAVAPKSAPPPKCGDIEQVAEATTEPFFMRGFSRISECEDPSVGALAVEDGKIYGSGVLVDSCHVLTAGHCADSVTPYWFICEGEFFRVASVVLHPNYKIGDSVLVDLAVLTLDSPCPTTPTPVPAEGYQIARGGDLTAIGHGGGIRRKSNPGVFWHYGTLVEEPTLFKFLPLEGTVWFGDSGGAIYDNSGVLVGIISSLGFARGHLYENSATRLDLFRDWIVSAMEDTPCN
jgi:hypothetical protein